MSKRVSRPPFREGFVDPTAPGLSFAQPKGGAAKETGDAQTAQVPVVNQR
jgi:hypothetical protein